VTCNAILWAWMGAGRERAFCMGCSWARRTDGDVVTTLKETGLPARAGLMRVHLLWRWRLHLHRVNVDLLRSHRLRRIRRILLLHVRLCHGHGRWDRKRHLHLKGLARRDPVWHHHLHLLPGAGILHHEGGSRSEARRARHRHRRRRPHLVAQKQADIQLLLHHRSCCWLEEIVHRLREFLLRHGTSHLRSSPPPSSGQGV
jgi:hypothetical protein